MMNRIFTIQSKLLEKIAEYDCDNQERDWPLEWERIHMISCAKVGHFLALKRGVDAELAAIACSVHDYGRIVTGRQKNHATAAYEPLKTFLAAAGKFTADEVEILAQAARVHSNKDEVGSPLEEVIKDADVLDCYQYGILPEREEQKKRLDCVLTELNIK
ncbi:MAG: metal dependent phosphohydrolase [Firmicutes bacterium]|nr:metal dependent phosphohydrolase [Bacillota bacterium]